MTTSTLTLTDFLLARIAEDEAQATRSKEDAATGKTLGVPASWVTAVADRVLAECEAKRRIVNMAWDHFGEDDYAWGMEEAKRQILLEMAQPFADHPEFRAEWKP